MLDRLITASLVLLLDRVTLNDPTLAAADGAWWWIDSETRPCRLYHRRKTGAVASLTFHFRWSGLLPDHAAAPNLLIKFSVNIIRR